MDQSSNRPRAPSDRQNYLDSLQPPSLADIRRISEIQLAKETEIDSKYHSAQELQAATKIQSAYRGHRERRQIAGLVLDPSSRWLELISELKYRTATAPHKHVPLSPDGRPRAAPDVAKLNWRRAGWVAEHASRGDGPTNRPRSHSSSSASDSNNTSRNLGNTLMDLRYFLEMVDQQHRYGANLQIYHECWQRQDTKQNFFVWLDHGPGRHLDLPLCSREKLDRERIRYLSKEERKDYLVEVDDLGRLRWAKNGTVVTTSVEEYMDSMHGIVPKTASDQAFSDQHIQNNSATDRTSADHLTSIRNSRSTSSHSTSSASISSVDSGEASKPGQPSEPKKPSKRHLRVSPAAVLNHLLRASVKPGTWIFVADTVGRLYISIKSSGAFQHATFLSGARISSAGSIGVKDGQLTYLSPLSGHYRPTTHSFKTFLSRLDEQGVDLSRLRVSGAYKVLKGMEVYGGVKKGLHHVRHPVKHEEKWKRPPSPASKEQRGLDMLHEAGVMTATDLVQMHWEQEHKKGGTRRLS